MHTTGDLIDRLIDAAGLLCRTNLTSALTAALRSELVDTPLMEADTPLMEVDSCRMNRAASDIYEERKAATRDLKARQDYN